MEALAEEWTNPNDTTSAGFSRLTAAIGITFLVFVVLTIGAQLGRREEAKRWIVATGCESYTVCEIRSESE